MAWPSLADRGTNPRGSESGDLRPKRVRAPKRFLWRVGLNQK